MPPQQNVDMILQQIFDQIRDLRTDIQQNFVSKDTHDAQIGPMQADIAELKDRNKAWLTRLYTVVALANAIITLLIVLHIIPAR